MDTKDYITIATSTVALGVSIWTRIDTILEKRQREKKLAPWGELRIVPIPVLTEADGKKSYSRQAEIIFHNTLKQRFTVESVEIIQPKHDLIMARSSSGIARSAGRKIPVEWIVKTELEAKDGCSGKLIIISDEMPVQSKIHRYIIECRGIDASSEQRKIRIEVALAFKMDNAAI